MPEKEVPQHLIAVLILLALILLGLFSFVTGVWSYGTSRGVGAGMLMAGHLGPEGYVNIKEGAYVPRAEGMSMRERAMQKVNQLRADAAAALKPEGLGVYDTGSGQRSTPATGKMQSIMSYGLTKDHGLKLPSF